MADLTQREALAKDLFVQRGWGPDDWEAIAASKSRLGIARQQARDDVATMLTLGFRAPGPPTEEEVERAAAAICDARLWPGAWIKANEVESDNLRHEARAALTAALGRPE